MAMATRNNNNSSRNNKYSNKNSLFCDYCNRPRHNRSQCRKLQADKGGQFPNNSNNSNSNSNSRNLNKNYRESSDNPSKKSNSKYRINQTSKEDTDLDESD